MIKKYLISFGYSIIIILVATFLLTVLNYFGILNNDITNIFKLIIPIISLFVGAYIIGKNSNKKGYIEGIKYGLMCVILMIVLSIIIEKTNFNITSLIYYLILLISSTFGSMIGINRKKGN